MLTIRLSRGGAKKRPFYHIVSADKRSARDGRWIERLGYFNPVAKGQEVQLKINHERIGQLTSNGAQVSERVKSLLKLSTSGSEKS